MNDHFLIVVHWLVAVKMVTFGFCTAVVGSNGTLSREIGELSPVTHLVVLLFTCGLSYLPSSFPFSFFKTLEESRHLLPCPYLIVVLITFVSEIIATKVSLEVLCHCGLLSSMVTVWTRQSRLMVLWIFKIQRRWFRVFWVDRSSTNWTWSGCNLDVS